MRRLVLLPALLAFLVGAPPALAWTWPVEGPVLQPFVLGGDPYAAGQHRGIDVGAAEGAPVRAPASGTVSFAGAVPSGGRSITIQTPDGYVVTLLHLGAVLVAEGDAVAEGADVGVAGWSGVPEQTTPSVHLGVRIATQSEGYVDPASFLPAPSGVAVEADPDEPAITPAVAAAEDELPAPEVAVATIPSQPDDAAAAPETLPQVVQPDIAGAADVEVAPLEPLVVVSAGSTAPPAASEAPVDIATPEPSAGARSHPASATAPQAANSSAPPPAAGDPITPTSTARSHGGAGVSRADARRVEQRRRPDRPEPTGLSRRGRIARGEERIVVGHPARVRPDAGSIERAAPRFAHDVGQTQHGAAAVEVTGAGAWGWRAGLATIVAAVAVVLLVRRSGRGGQRSAVRVPQPSAPPLGAAQGPEPGVGPAPALLVARRDPRALAPRPGRRLDRGGPGGPVKHPAAGVRGRRASV